MPIRALYGICSNVNSSGFTAGLECEIENLGNTETVNSGRWTITEDGSLRNKGLEFITRLPSGKDLLMEDFKHLHQAIKFRNGTINPFSERTSIHVHVNCLDLDHHQVKSIMQHYALFEPIFFKLVAPERANNIHCVALNQTVIPESYRRDLTVLVGAWSKYTALNLLPLKEIGTIEFRHLQGTSDAVLLNEWLTVLENLWTFGKDNLMDKKSVTDPTYINTAYNEIFKNTRASLWAPAATNLLQDSLIDLKLAFH